MEIYIVIIGNYINNVTDTCGVFSSLELAKRQEAPADWFIDHIEVWRLNCGYIRTIDIEEEEEDEI